MTPANVSRTTELSVESLWTAFSVLGKVPRRDIENARREWKTIGAGLIEKVAAFTANPRVEDGAADGILIVVHLAAELRDTRAYVPWLELVSLPEEWLELAIGDAITETLSLVFASVFDGDPEPLERVIADPRTNEYVVGQLLDTLAFLTGAGRIPVDHTHAFLDRYYHALPQDHEHGLHWAGWEDAVSYLGLTEYRERVQEAYEREWVDPFMSSYEHFERRLVAGEAARESGIYPVDRDHDYFRDTIGLLSTWYAYTSAYLRDCAQAEEQAGIERLTALKRSIPEYLKGVGRNEPCPCGSGRKFKKCCMPRSSIALPA